MEGKRWAISTLVLAVILLTVAIAIAVDTIGKERYEAGQNDLYIKTSQTGALAKAIGNFTYGVLSPDGCIAQCNRLGCDIQPG